MNHKLKHITLAYAAYSTSAVCLTIMKDWEEQQVGQASQPENLISLLKSTNFSLFKEKSKVSAKGTVDEEVAKHQREI